MIILVSAAYHGNFRTNEYVGKSTDIKPEQGLVINQDDVLNTMIQEYLDLSCGIIYLRL